MIPRAMPWARSFWAFSPYLNHLRNLSKVKATTGQTVIAFITSIRLKEAQRIIRSNPNILVSDVAIQVGFNTPKYFSKCFKKEFGIFPKEYAEQLKKR
ncbi:helix-turn-helix transcriptional regulator [Prevotella copri]|nr:helix-turn-helix transcriptional regulator [Segatella copri]